MIPHGFFLEYLLSIPIIAWCTGQLLKVGIRLLSNTHNRKYTWGSGGMPSVHSCFVLALTTALGIKYGWNSPYFIISLSFSGIVLYDAMHVRFQSGQHAKVINRLIKKDSFDLPEEFTKLFPLHEQVGHTPLEVGVGMLLGIVVAFLLTMY